MTDLQVLLVFVLSFAALGGYVWLCDRVRG
jgi:hypothetical protein